MLAHPGMAGVPRHGSLSPASLDSNHTTDDERSIIMAKSESTKMLAPESLVATSFLSPELGHGFGIERVIKA